MPISPPDNRKNLPPRLADEEIEAVIESAIQQGGNRITIEKAALPGSNMYRAIELAEHAGWFTRQDGRTGVLMLSKTPSNY